jgi:hypothetical protein
VKAYTLTPKQMQRLEKHLEKVNAIRAETRSAGLSVVDMAAEEAVDHMLDDAAAFFDRVREVRRRHRK